MDIGTHRTHDTESPNFRFNGRSVFLTYPRTDFDIPAYILWLKEHLVNRTRVSYARVAREIHVDGCLHIHALVGFERKLSTRDSRFFDYKGRHPNIRSTRNILAASRYLEKGNDYVDEGRVPTARRGTRDSWEEAVEISTSAETFAQAIISACPRDAAFLGNRLDAFGERLFPPADPYPSELEPSSLRFALCFTILTLPTLSHGRFRLPQLVLDWVSGHFQRPRPSRPLSLFLHGPSRTGKTTWARTLTPKSWYFGGMFNIDKCQSYADLAIFDDVEWSNFRFFYKQWLGAQLEFEVTDKYHKKKTIHWGNPCIYICNTLPEFSVAERDWLDVNVVFCHVDGSLIDDRNE